MTSMRNLAVVLLLASTLAVGCFRTSITVQGGSGTVPLSHDDTWHHAVIYGLVDLSSPHDLDAICPGGTVSVYSETRFLNGLVQAITFNLYNPQTVTVTCTQASEPAAIPAGQDSVPAADEGSEPAPAPAPSAATEAEEELPPAPPPDAP
jgi:hypothetical protein